MGEDNQVGLQMPPECAQHPGFYLVNHPLHLKIDMARDQKLPGEEQPDLIIEMVSIMIWVVIFFLNAISN